MEIKSSQQKSDMPAPMLQSFPQDEARLPWLSLLLNAYAIIDRGISIAVSREKRRRKKRPACSEQCDVCCRANTDIPVYPLELAGITWYTVEMLGQPLRQIIAQQLLYHKAAPPCPFLTDGICAVYPVRPVACRQYIVFGRACADNEDPYYTRREDVLTPIQEFTDEAVSLMLPFYGITKEQDKARAITTRFIDTKVRNMFSCNWKTLAEKIEAHDAADRQTLKEDFKG